MPFQKKELSKLRIDHSRQKTGWITTQKMFSNSEAGLSLHNEDLCVSGWARGILEKPRFQNMNVTCTKPVLSSTTSPVLGFWDRGPRLLSPGVSLGNGLAFLRSRIKLPQGEPGNCFWAKSKVRELRIKWPLALTVHRLRWWGECWKRKCVEVKKRARRWN